MKKCNSLKAAALVAAMLPGAASAFTIFDAFGEFEADWGGNGIPSDRVASSKQFVFGPEVGGTTITVAMSATQRYSNPALTDNGAAIYQAGAGSNDGIDGNDNGQGALWNWNYYIELEGDGALSDYQIDLWYDLEAGPQRVMGDLSGLGRISLNDAIAFGEGFGIPEETVYQGSENNMFAYLETAAGTPWVTPPGGAFDPNAIGNYQFAITVNTGGDFNFPVDAVAMEVNVVPIPAAAWLFGSAILGLVAVKRRKV